MQVQHNRQIRRRSLRSAFANGDEIRRLRLNENLKQDELRDKIFEMSEGEDEPVSLRTIRNSECGQRVSLKKLALIAAALGCSDVGDLIRSSSKLRWAMMDEVFASANGRLGNQGGIFLRLLQSLDGSSSETIIERELLLALAIKRDVDGDAHGALRLGSLLVRESSDCDAGFRTRVGTRVASFCDHAGVPKRGLALLAPLLKANDLSAEEQWWVLLQYGILLGQVGQMKKAWNTLTRVRDEAPTPEHKTAALHQLAMLEIREAHSRRLRGGPSLQRAKERLEMCVQERLRNSRNDFRLVYEYHRLCEVCTELGEISIAKSYSKKAEAITTEWSFPRYVEKMERLQHHGRQ